MASTRGEELLSWKGISGNLLVLPEPSHKHVARYEQSGLIPLRTLLGVFDIFWECVRRVIRAKTNKVVLVNLPKKGCGNRKQMMEELIQIALSKRNSKRIFELRMMCHVFQAEEILELYAHLMMNTVGGIPKRNERFSEWLKRLHVIGKCTFFVGHDGWKYARRVREF